MASALENILLNSYKNEMVAFIKTHPQFVDEALELAITNKQPFSWRAAWLLSSVIEKNDKRLKPYVSNILNRLPEFRDGHQRELLSLVQLMDLNEVDEGRLFDVAVTIWERIGSRPSVRYTALRIILNMADKYPELAREIAFLMQPQYLETLSPGIKRAVMRLGNEMAGQQYNT
ncbi:MAG: hypothetical protein ACOC10_01605 [Bacteroidota bacterium]